MVLAEIVFGIRKISPDQRALRLEQGLASWRRRFADRIYGFSEAATLAYGDIMADAVKLGRPMTVQDGMIAATARVNSGRLATRNVTDVAAAGLERICPWSAK